MGIATEFDMRNSTCTISYAYDTYNVYAGNGAFIDSNGDLTGFHQTSGNVQLVVQYLRTASEEIYVLNVDTKQMETTLTEITTSKFISVENYAAKRTADLIAQQMMVAVTDMDQKIQDMTPVVPPPVVVKPDDNTVDMTRDNFSPNSVGQNIVVAQKDDSDIDPVGIAALVIGVCALVVGVANMVYMGRSRPTEGGNGGDSVGDSVDQKTLGSKIVA